jgi:hypothetical protein
MGVSADQILLIGCGRDPRDAQIILQQMATLYYKDIVVEQGSETDEPAFVDKRNVFLNYKRSPPKNTAGKALVEFSNRGPFSIINLSALTDLYANMKDIEWGNCKVLLVSGGPDANGYASHNLRLDLTATQALLPFLATLHTMTVFIGPVLCATSMLCHTSCNKTTLPKALNALWSSKSSAAGYIRRWIETWDEQWTVESNPHFKKQFAPADVFVATIWVLALDCSSCCEGPSVDMKITPNGNRLFLDMSVNNDSPFVWTNMIDMNAVETCLVTLFEA